MSVLHSLRLLWTRAFALPLVLRTLLGAALYLGAAQAFLAWSGLPHAPMAELRTSGPLLALLTGVQLLVGRWLTMVVTAHVHARTFSALLTHEPLVEHPFGPESDWETHRLMEAAESMMATHLPQWLAATVATLLLLPTILGDANLHVSPLLLLVGALSLAFALGSRKWAHRELLRGVERYHRVAELIGAVATARLELIGNGRKDAVLLAGKEAVAEWQKRSLLGSIPPLIFRRSHWWAIGAIAIGLRMWGGPGVFSTPSVGGTILFAAPILGAISSLSELVLQSMRFSPLGKAMEDPALPVSRVGVARRIEFRRVSVAYGDTEVLSDINLVFEPGYTAIVGMNGAGKSTLLKTMLAVAPTARGDVLFDANTAPCEAAYLPQAPCMRDSLSVLENLNLLQSATPHEWKTQLGEAGILEALERKASDPLTVRVGELSSGQRQRIALARVFASKSRLFLLDEPDANLDMEAVDALVARIERRKADAIVVVAAHSSRLVEAADRVITLEDGRVVSDVRRVGNRS